MATVPRQLRRLQNQLLEAEQRVEAREDALVKAETKIQELEDAITGLKAVVANERTRRVFAQRGLVNYMHEHGLGDRIGYDPDKEPEVLADIPAGSLPPAPRTRLIRQPVAET